MMKGLNETNIYPIYNSENEAFCREESNGIWSIMSREHAEIGYVKLNRMAEIIKSLCDGQHSIKDINQYIIEHFTIPPNATLFEDIYRTLHSFWRLGLLDFIGENPIEKQYRLEINNRTYKMLDKRSARNFVTDCSEDAIFNAYVNSKNDYTEVDVNMRWLSSYESFYEVLNEDNIPIVKMAVRLNGYNKTYEISIIDPIKEDKVSEVLPPLMEFIHKIYKEVVGYDITANKEKPVFHFYHLNKHIQFDSFTLKGELKYEIGKKSVFLYEYCVG